MVVEKIPTENIRLILLEKLANWGFPALLLVGLMFFFLPRMSAVFEAWIDNINQSTETWKVIGASAQESEKRHQAEAEYIKQQTEILKQLLQQNK